MQGKYGFKHQKGAKDNTNRRYKKKAPVFNLKPEPKKNTETKNLAMIVMAGKHIAYPLN